MEQRTLEKKEGRTNVGAKPHVDDELLLMGGAVEKRMTTWFYWQFPMFSLHVASLWFPTKADLFWGLQLARGQTKRRIAERAEKDLFIIIKSANDVIYTQKNTRLAATIKPQSVELISKTRVCEIWSRTTNVFEIWIIHSSGHSLRFLSVFCEWFIPWVEYYLAPQELRQKTSG